MVRTQENRNRDKRAGLALPLRAVAALVVWLGVLSVVPQDGWAQKVPVMRDNAMVEAARRGDVATLQTAYANGMKADRQGINGLSPLHVAAQFGRSEAVAALLAMTKKVDHRDRDRQTALGHSVLNGHGDVVALLLAAGADPDRSGPNYEPPLVVAARRGDMAIVTALLDAGADVTLGDNTGRTALEWARAMRHEKIMAALEAR